MSITIASPTRYCTNQAVRYMINKYCPKGNAAILDVGCGRGHYYQFFSSCDIKGSYLGIDIKEHELWQIKEANGMQIAYLVHDAEKLQDLKQKFDFIIAIQSLEHITNDMEVIKNMVMCLNDGGYITLTIPSKYCFFLYPTHGNRRYSISDIKRLAMNNGLRIEETTKIGGLTNFILHFILWTIPAAFGIEIWNFYKNNKLLLGLIANMERLSIYFDRVFRILEGGYATALKIEET